MHGSKTTGYEDAWKPANFTTGRGKGPGRTLKPLSQNFRWPLTHYIVIQSYYSYPPLPTTQASVAVMCGGDADVPQTQVEP